MQQIKNECQHMFRTPVQNCVGCALGLPQVAPKPPTDHQEMSNEVSKPVKQMTTHVKHMTNESQVLATH